MTYCCKEFKNIKIILKEKKKYRNQYDEINYEPSLSAKFSHGIYQTKDEEIIAYLDKYMSKYPNMLKKFDEEKEEFIQQKISRAKEKAEKEYEKQTNDI